MVMPHWLHIYNKPKLAVTNGDGLRRRLLARNYRHSINCMGWFDAATCSVDVSSSDAEEIFAEYVGNRVAIFVDNPVVPVWEGIINRVTIEYNKVALTASIDEMANKVQALYTTTAGSPNDQMTVTVDDLASQAIYGVKMATLDLGNTYAAATATPNIATIIRDRYLATNAYPLISKAGSAQRELKVTIEMQGFYHTLKWDQQQVTDTGTATPSGMISRYLYYLPDNPPRFTTLNGSAYSGNGNGLFFNDAALYNFTTFNDVFTYPRTKRLGESIWDFLVKITEAGDGTQGFILGINPTDPNTGYRIAYYLPENQTVEYITWMYGDNRIYTTAGNLVMPWDVRPDRKIRIADALIGWNKPGGDPREAYIRSVSYDAEQGRVTWTSADNITLQGVFNLNKLTQKTGSSFPKNDRKSYS